MALVGLVGCLVIARIDSLAVAQEASRSVDSVRRRAGHLIHSFMMDGTRQLSQMLEHMSSLEDELAI